MTANPTSNIKKIKGFYICMGMLTVLLAVANIFLSGRTISVSTSLKLQEQHYAQLLSEKDQLTAQLTEVQSLQSIENKAVAEGYVQIAKTVAVKSAEDTSVASR